MDRNAQWRALMDRRLSSECNCGNHKQQGNPYCLFCWRKLPRRLRPLLHEMKGYERTIEECDAAIADAPEEIELPDLCG
jgi:hypothetical protein